MEVRLKEFDETYLEYSWNWLLDPEIRFLTNAADFTKEQQRDWFKNIPAMEDYLIWGVEADSVPIGVCGLKKITSYDCEYWGYIGEKDYWGIGAGKEMMIQLEEKSRQMGKHSLWLKVIKENPRAIAFYSKSGYVVESESEKELIMRKTL